MDIEIVSPKTKKLSHQIWKTHEKVIIAKKTLLNSQSKNQEQAPLLFLSTLINFVQVFAQED